MSDAMGDLRSALHEPSETSWKRVTELLTSWESHRQLVEEAIPYAHELITRWPEDIPRELPLLWQESFYGNKKPLQATFELVSLVSKIAPKSMWSYRAPASPLVAPSESALPLLATQIQVNASTPADRLVWLANSEIPRLRDLGLYHSSLTAEQAKVWSSASWMGETLTNLDVVAPDDAIVAMFDGVRLPGLEVLSIAGAEGMVHASGLLAMLDAGKGSNLHTIDCSSAWLSQEAASIIATHEALANVVDLNLRYNAYIGSDGVEEILRSRFINTHVKDDINDYYEDIFE